jgi:AraC-like DNA-binding protein
LLAAEGRSTGPGRRLALSRLVDLLLVQAIRHWVGTEPDVPQGWLLGLRDPRIALALSRMHEAPEQAWTVPRLGREVGMSRSSFADRFGDLIGEPPSRYLTRWRIHLAARLMRSPGSSLSALASRVGYSSEAAFSRAFRRVLGVSPGAYRRSSTLRHP